VADYKVLKKNLIKTDNYCLMPIRYQDRYLIMKWRNEQMYHLRQSQYLTHDDQDYYFSQVISKIFVQSRPDQILFSFLKNNICVGYGGLVHINWEDRNAEISFLLDTSLQKEFFAIFWEVFLKMIQEVAFDDLRLHKIFTYAFDLRPNLYPILEKSTFKLEARLIEHTQIDNRYVDVLIHSKINNEYNL
jgi:RimJ/RimL family protein N-acetyltransferase